MSVDLERKLQNKVLHWLVDSEQDGGLGYKYLGNLEDTDNTPVKEDLLKKNLEKRGYTRDQITKAVTELVNKTKNQVDRLYQINMDIYSLLRYGRQGIKDDENNRQTVHYIDWDNLDNNDFYVAEEVSVLCFNQRERKRPDIVIYVNGIALAVFELKRSCVSIGEGIRQNITNQKKEYIQNFFSTIQLIFAGNEAEGLKYGTIETPEKYYLKWKEDSKATDELSVKIKELHSKEKNRLKNDIISLCHKERLLSIIYDFLIFDAGVKKVARHNQYFANIAAREKIKNNEGGIIWNTQGSGKSLIMVWLTKWIIENITDSRVVIITDREELDDQIESLFIDVNEKVTRTKSCAHLREILNKNEDAIVCSLIHKYGHNAGTQSDIDQYRKELLKDLPPDFKAKGKIIGFIDECHRTNSGKLHEAVKTLMPEAILIGFTGTPLLKRDKATSLEIFGPYIHTYKFDEGVEDGVVLDLRYEARDVDQDLSSKDKVDLWFENKTKGLTERAKTQLKQSWTSINKLYSSKQRLEKIAADIIFDMDFKPRLKNDRGTAMLVAGSIYEACRYWDILTSNGFNKCAIITSYEPSAASVRTATSDLSQEGEEEYKKSVYERMLKGKKISEFEKEAKEQFKKEPAKMKLLIVRDKLLTGFDAPSATYLYIDKSMRDHDLFQAICRVNRPDGEDKDYGYIVDYKDLFRNVQLAVADYTSGAFEDFDKEDIEGLIKNRYDEAKSEMVGSMASLKDLLENVSEPKKDVDYIDYFCGDDSEDDQKTSRREILYSLTSSLTRSFANCSDKLVSDYGYSEEQVNKLRSDISNYNKIKEMVKLASNDYIDLKPYEADMRYILDTYIRAEDSTIISELENMTLVELLLKGTTTTPVEALVQGIPGDNNAKAEIIVNNLQHEIVKKMSSNEVYYGKMSDMLQKIIEERRIEAMSYEELLRQVVELAKAIFHPEDSSDYPETIKNSEARRAIFDYLNQDEKLAFDVDSAIRQALRPGWKTNFQKQQNIRLAIYQKLLAYGYSEDEATEKTKEVFDIAGRQVEYDE
ncbi:HsdR family type I site-specific deoxyribonuclease [Clostridioides difficile]|uniref:type I restriction endonuclease subunit R n=1 Tax=Clostridioides difficile TaxID=1496 RepID=UPI0009424FBF|nr:HsdR family type I site-specific deoxyribonuclease [Clostridioides difficile]EGT3688639.1 HsdR family type I site-specific deoxyribonuclease [Clostridioides difficile]EKG0820801.1 HsdR family type I site-specific deoxyribonuclease [Clostridioides difficile]MBF9946802.1 HsdR family type I site-specific deoxyribonuclease [Clostridioides difficile]MBH7228390.1 HsdR family type I site-specific deoxyribonuclease [Clostridioides difficile]MBH7790481.1 HsdR family type I site-specific deoxyribonuc